MEMRRPRYCTLKTSKAEFVLDKVSLKDPDVVIFVVVLAVNDNGIKNTDNIPTRRLGLSYATRESKVFTVKSKGIVATNLKP